MHHGKLFWHRRLRGKRSRVEVLRLPLQDRQPTPEREGGYCEYLSRVIYVI
jgi:hypothetical protein